MYFGTVLTVWEPKKFLVTLFPYIFHVKTKSNIVYEYLKTKIFSREIIILPQMHWTSNIFWHLATIIWDFLVSLNSVFNLKKMVCPKNVWMQHCFTRLENLLYLTNECMNWADYLNDKNDAIVSGETDMLLFKF